MPAPNRAGRVYLVGAGPGDPGLITLRGVSLLRQADVVLFDYLVNPAVMQFARPEAKKVCLGKHGSGRMLGQDEVNQAMIEAALAGNSVVRLKGGDPAVFGRGAEETEALVAAGIRFEVVPGVTAALAAGSYAGIPVTHRQMASAVALVTGHESDHKDARLDFQSLAQFPGTLVFYMGVTTIREWTTQLLAAGKPPETPVAVVRRVSWPDQSSLHTTLGNLAHDVEARRLRPPVLTIVGDVVTLASRLSWFDRRPLFGQKILVTRPLHQCEDLRELLAEEGADVLVAPAIEIGPPANWTPVDEAISNLSQFDWLVFSSSNGVNFFLNRVLEQTGGDLRCLGHVKLAAVGPGTAEALRQFHLRADVVPEEYRAEALAAALAGPGAKNQRFLLLRASRGREVLAEQLAAAGGKVSQVVCYMSSDAPQADPEIIEALNREEIDWVTVTSSAIARSLQALYGVRLHTAKLASISPITSATLRELGYEPAVEASTYTMAGVAEAIEKACQQC